jgi:chromosome partitioning protein
VICLALANSKGGVGKTTTAVHVATGLARAGHRTLLVDLDPQANATAWLVSQVPPTATTSAEALTTGRVDTGRLLGVPVEDGAPPLRLLPATAALASADLQLAGEVAGETLLGRALDGLAGEVDFAILDCPPNLGLTVLSALCAADGVVAPVLPAFLSLAGLRRLEDTCERIRVRLNVRTQVLGYLLFAADAREAITAESRELLRREAGEKLLTSEIRVSTAAKALPAHRRTAWSAGADARGREDYEALVAELLERTRGLAPRGRNGR